jgi:glucose/arabinose dehydrogenase
MIGTADNNLYIPIGDVDGSFNPKGQYVRTMTQNYLNSTLIDGRSRILRVDLNRPISSQGILGDEHPLDYYYAYGIRNSFGINFDPLTGNLWDTENGQLMEMKLILSSRVLIADTHQYKEYGLMEWTQSPTYPLGK